MGHVELAMGVAVWLESKVGYFWILVNYSRKSMTTKTKTTHGGEGEDSSMEEMLA